MAALEPVRVVFRKWDGRLHWHFWLRLLGEDDHGVWLAGPPGTVLQRGGEAAKHETDGFVMLVPRADSWTAIWNVDDDPEVYVDVTTLPEWSRDSVAAVDLDLDVVRYRDGTVALLDEDEFEEHRLVFGYPPTVADAAVATAHSLLDAVAHRVEPFDAAPSRWLAGAHSLGA